MPNNIEVNNQYDIVKREGEREEKNRIANEMKKLTHLTITNCLYLEQQQQQQLQQYNGINELNALKDFL